MHTVELLEQAIAAAERLGFTVRLEWLGGNEGGGCEFGGQKWLFIDLSLSHIEQLDQVIQTIAADPGASQVDVSGELRNLFGLRKAA